MPTPDLFHGRARGGQTNHKRDERSLRSSLGPFRAWLLIIMTVLDPALAAAQNGGRPERAPRSRVKVPTAFEDKDVGPASGWPDTEERRTVEEKRSLSTKPPLPVDIPRTPSGKGPDIRIGLVTNGDFASIACDGPMARYEGADTDAERVADGKVTVLLNTGESRRQQRGKTYQVQVATFAEKSEADDFAGELRDKFDDPVTTRFDRDKKRYVVAIGKYASPSDAQTMMVRVVNAGYRKPWVERADTLDATRKKETPRWELRALGASGDEVARHPQKLTFVALDGERYPLKYLGSRYRGKLEVFLNRRQRLTVVNVLPMEDYVRGVVPNELSPSGFPQLEALKAQAVAARTYAVRNRGNYSEEGFDLLPTALSQVYGGRSTEHPLTDRAVAETRGIVATYQGEPINALYTSTSGGKTEDAEFVFGKPVPYLKSTITAPVEQKNPIDRRLETERRMDPVTDGDGRSLAREAALLMVVGLPLPEKLSSSVGSPVTQKLVEQWADKISLLARQKPAPAPPRTATDLGGFARLVLGALYGGESPAQLMTEPDARYLLGDAASQIPESYRTDVAFLVREGIVRPANDGTFRARGTLAVGAAMGILARALAARGLPKLESGTARPYDGGRLTVRGGKGKEDPSFELAARFHLFRKLGGEWFPMARTDIIGGETVTFHLDARGRIDYLEVTPVLNGATSDRFSPFSWWDERLTPAEVRARLARYNISVGQVLDLQPIARGRSGRVSELRVIGTDRTATVEGIRIRSVLAVRESLFVIERALDDRGKVTEFRIRGRGWGHGVGMCQVGAYGLALEGYAYDRILKHFYSGIQLTRMW